MKKTALLLCLFMVSVMMPQAVWATDGITLTGPQESPATEITVTTSSAGQVSSMVNAWTQGGGIKSNVTKITLKGTFDSSDLAALGNRYNNADNFPAVTTVDMSEATFVKSSNSYIFNKYQLFHDQDAADEVDPSPSIGTKAIIGGSLYEWATSANTWKSRGTSDPGVSATYYANVSDMNSAAGSHNVGDYAKIPNSTSTYKYMQMHFIDTKNWEYLSISAPEGIVHDYTDLNNTWLESELESKKNESFLYNGCVIKVLRFYKLIDNNGNREWVHCDNLTERPRDRENGEGGSDIVYVGEIVGADIDHLDPKQGVLNSYIRFNVYYRFNVNCEWTNETSDAPNEFTVGGFDYTDRDNHKTYKDGEWVQMYYSSGFDYYQLVSGTNSWEPRSYENGDVVEDPWFYTNSNGDRIGRYAVVYGTAKTWNGTSWGDNNVSVPYFSDMKFEYWSSSLTTAITSKYADETISSEIFKDCIHLTTVNYMSGNVTGLTNRVSPSYPDLSLTIGKDVTKIDAYALKGSSALTSLEFDMTYSKDEKESGNYPKPLVIGDDAFEDCVNLMTVNFPNRVIEIGDAAFKQVLVGLV